MANKEYLKISKETIWWVAKYLIGMYILYIVYTKTMPWGIQFGGLNNPVHYIEFLGWVIIIPGLLVAIYGLLMFFVGDVIIGNILKFMGNPLEGIPKFKVTIPVTGEDIEKFDKKFKRKIVKYPDGKSENEHDWDFSKRFILQAIDEKLKRGR